MRERRVVLRPNSYGGIVLLQRGHDVIKGGVKVECCGGVSEGVGVN